MHRLLWLVALLFLCSFSDTSLIKRISDAQFRYEFYTTTKKVSPKPGRSYYWFKGGAIHNSEYGMAGELLTGDFAKFYHSNQLAEAGTFKNGLKTGLWKTWYENGILHTEAEWSSGTKDGAFALYDNTGKLLEKGAYDNDRKSGRWINYTTKDTLKYRNGEVVPVKVKPVKSTAKDSVSTHKPGLWKRWFDKKDDKGSKVKRNDVTSKVDARPGFWQRLFGKKKKGEKPINTNSTATPPKEVKAKTKSGGSSASKPKSKS
ncbi:toxin-antitoxin system YwqK family antitoxin [Flavobacterium sp. RNTU_13]|uniref:toxin-antitoxin system YwqK family antitoxin n=1 Tax=Flavobacterium sp. RNTU_13 TaxID=3375145 RepID=UPI00398622F0